MTLTVGRKRNQVRRITMASARFLALFVLIALPVYQSTAVRSPSPTVAESNVIRVSQPKKPTVAKKAKNTVVKKSSANSLANVSCTSSAPMRPGIASARSSQIKKLSQYENVCKSGVFSKLSFFVATPTTAQEANEYADYVSTKLLEFARYGIQPVVFFEPTTSTGLVDMKKYRSGTYDVAIDKFFSLLKTAGVTNATMGTWVPIPEGNIPVWTSLAPSDFSAVVTKAVKIQKKYFPASKASVLLDSMTYPRSKDWSGGRSVSLVPYLKTIPRGLIDSIGLQGFPWVSPANQGSVANGTVRDFLRVDRAAEAAAYLGVKQVWLNTGTFSKKYANIAGQQVTVSPAKRMSILKDVVVQAQSLKSRGYGVSIHLFAEDKSRVAEATDWSYWQNKKAATSSSTIVLKTFARDSQKAGIPLWLFDTQ